MLNVSRYTLLAATAAFALCWLMPGHYWPWLSFQQEFAAAIGALLIGLTLLLRVKGFEWPRLALVAFACAAVPMLQWQFGLVRFFSDALLSALYLAGFGLCIVAGATAVRTRNDRVLASILGALTFGATLCVGLALLQWQNIRVGYFFDGAPQGSRAWANLGQSNHLASVLAIGVCAVLLAYCRRVGSGAFTAIMLCWFGLGLITTQSRTGYVFVLVLATGLLIFRRRAALPLHPLAVVTATSLFFVAVTLWPALNVALNMSEPGGVVQRVTGQTLRLIHYQVIADAIFQRPWFGYGWTQVALAQHAALAEYPAAGEVLSSSHNIVLDLLAWNGLPIGLTLVGYITWWFVRQFQTCDSPDRFFALAIACALTIHAMVEFPLQYSYFLLPLGFAVGALEGRRSGGAVSTSRTSRFGFAAAWGGLAVMTGWIAAEYIEVESTSRTLRFVSLGIGTDKVSKAPEPDVLLLDRPRNLHRFMLTPARVDPDPAYIEWVRFMTMRHATPSAMLRHAVVEGRNGHPEKAAQVLVRYCKLFVGKGCEQGREMWAQFQTRYPELAAIPYPAALPRK
jgi:Virulence factor membrane-bound polymerase, C-terminal/O-Antigen ligase/Protein glycosylation ligase